MSGRRAKQGLTLTEVIVSLGLLAGVALVIVGVFLALLRTSAKNREQAVAELLTESLLEKATASGPPGWGVDGRIGSRIEAVLAEDGSRFFYQIDPVAVQPEPAQADGHSWQVTVTVGWWLDGESGPLDQAREGFGNQWVKGVRTVYLRNGDRV